MKRIEYIGTYDGNPLISVQHNKAQSARSAKIPNLPDTGDIYVVIYHANDELYVVEQIAISFDSKKYDVFKMNYKTESEESAIKYAQEFGTMMWNYRRAYNIT